MKTMIIVPAFNEEESIMSVVKSIRLSNPNVDIVVVNDGSTDNTSVMANKSEATVVIDLPQNVGIGGAVQTGYLYALYNNYDVVVQIDGDGQHRPEDLCKLLDVLKDNNANMVIGSRFVEKTDYKMTFPRNWGIKYFAFLVSFLSKQKLTDTTSGYRACDKQIIKMFSTYYPHDYPEVETILMVAKAGGTIKEVSVNMDERQGGNSSITFFKSIYYMIKVTFSLLFMKKGGKFYD